MEVPKDFYDKIRHYKRKYGACGYSSYKDLAAILWEFKNVCDNIKSTKKLSRYIDTVSYRDNHSVRFLELEAEDGLSTINDIHPDDVTNYD